MPNFMHIRSAALTDLGKVRRNNEDRILCDDSLQLYGVADGIGGLPGGADAAECAVRAIHQSIRKTDGVPDLLTITHNANEAVAQMGLRLSPHLGIGTTLTWGLFRAGKLHLAHVGDTRCYLLQGGRFSCLTTDHSVANEAKARQLRGEPAWNQEIRGDALTRCIGQTTTPDVDLLERPLTAGDRYLFCSDGICRAIKENNLAELLGCDKEPQAIVLKLIEAANRSGGIDNATAVIVIVDSLT